MYDEENRWGEMTGKNVKSRRKENGILRRKYWIGALKKTLEFN
jgi:hypothetical protein